MVFVHVYARALARRLAQFAVLYRLDVLARRPTVDVAILLARGHMSATDVAVSAGRSRDAIAVIATFADTERDRTVPCSWHTQPARLNSVNPV